MKYISQDIVKQGTVGPKRAQSFRNITPPEKSIPNGLLMLHHGEPAWITLETIQRTRWYTTKLKLAQNLTMAAQFHGRFMWANW